MHTDHNTTRSLVAGAADGCLGVAGTLTYLFARPTYRRPLSGWLASALFLAVLAGCGDYEPAPAPVPKPVVTAPAPVEPTPEKVPEKTPEPVQTKAAVGMGAKGHYGGVGVVVTPVSVYFRARERIAFEIQVPEAMKLFKALEGRAPKTHEEFMERIIKENRINLPVLLPDERYIYDAKTEQLMIEQPARQ